jgi:hypothetical protein
MLTMSDINERIASVKYKMNEKERLRSLIASAEWQKEELQHKKDQLFRILKKEELDVDKLERVSFARLVHIIKGDNEDRLYEERKEALAAKLKYDEACAEVNNLSVEIDRLKGAAAELGNLENEYNNLIHEKEELIKSGGFKEHEELNRIMEEQVGLKSREKETLEAIGAGEQLTDSLRRVADSLSSAENWGVYDMLGGGMLATMAKHSRIDEARDEVEEAQSLLRRFHRELKDVGGTIDINVEIGSFLTFADYFFDGFFADWAVQSRINEASNKVDETLERVRNINYVLKADLRKTQRNYEELEKQRISIIENA